METILVVDDSQNIANFLAGSMLPSLGFQAIVAYRGQQAVKLVEENHQYINLILLDLNLQDMTGLEVLHELTQMNISIPTILMTAHGSEQVAVEAFRLGVYDYITKPIDEEQLQMAINRALANSRLLIETKLLTKKLEEQVRWLTLLGKVGKALTSTLDVDVVLKRIVDAGVILTRADEGFLALLDQPGNQLYLRAVKNIDVDTIKTLRLPTNDSLAGVVLKSGKPLRTSREDGGTLKVSTGYLVHSLLHVPLISKGVPLGVLSVDNRITHRAFTAADEAILVSLADYATVSLENANLYQHARNELTERQKVEAQLRYDNIHDRLTGLYNRSSLIDRLQHALDQLQRHSNRQFALLFFDIDRFKDINDTLGHLKGDQLLMATGALLAQLTRPSDLVARLGGDEFVMLLDDIKDVRDAIVIAERIQEGLASSTLIPDQKLSLTASIGIVLGSTHYTNPEDILRDADIAMYRAKARGKACFEIFDEQMRESIISRLALEVELHRAVDENQFVIHYQPILATSSQTLVGFEALVRWQHPVRGLLPPGEFIHVAEETGLIIAIDRMVLTEACRQLKTWRDNIPSLPNIKISVNLSGKQITRPDLVEFILKTINQVGIPAGSLNIEITESTIMENHARTIETLTAIQKSGVQIQVDDFGVGYSSLSYLSRFPMNSLKIDQSFVNHMTLDNTNMRIVQAIVMMTRGLGIKVVAEGVETPEQLNQLRDLGCESVQGYLLSEPMPADKVSNVLESIYSANHPAPWDTEKSKFIPR